MTNDRCLSTEHYKIWGSHGSDHRSYCFGISRKHVPQKHQYLSTQPDFITCPEDRNLQQTHQLVDGLPVTLLLALFNVGLSFTVTWHISYAKKIKIFWDVLLCEYLRNYLPNNTAPYPRQLCQQDHHGNLRFYSYTYLISKSCWWNTMHAGLYMSRNKLRFVAVSNKCSTMSLNSNHVMLFCVLGLSDSFTSSSSSSFWLPNFCSICLKTWTQK